MVRGRERMRHGHGPRERGNEGQTEGWRESDSRGREGMRG